MEKCALYVQLEAKPGKEKEVEEFLSKTGLEAAKKEPQTHTWFAMKTGPSTFGIFDTFSDEAGREAHLSGEIAKALKEKGEELLAKPPMIDKVDLLAAKIPA